MKSKTFQQSIQHLLLTVVLSSSTNCTETPPPPQSEHTQTNPIAQFDTPDFPALEQRLNEEVWQTEIEAQRYGTAIASFWDRLRQSGNSFQTLLNLDVDFVSLGSPGTDQLLEHGIRHRSLQPKEALETATIARERLHHWLTQGLQLEQSEWRHQQFWPALEGAPQSECRFTLHLLDPSNESRHIIRGLVRIRWKPGPDERPPAIESVRLMQGEWLSRDGPPPFAHVIPADLTPAPDSVVFEPNLQLQDLNKDGLSEIIVSRVNQIYWNRGQGQFRKLPLCDFPLAFLENGLFEDFNGDGHIDFLAFNTQEIAIFIGQSDGRFPHPPQKQSLPSAPLQNPFLATAGDVDGDGDLDLWLAQYRNPYQLGQMPTPVYDANDGFPSFLLLNDGTGRFTDGTQEAGLDTKRFRRTYSASFVDFDADQDQDLFVISDFAGADLFVNTGQGQFVDATDDQLPIRSGFGMAHAFADFNRDQRLDLFMIGMNAPIANRLDQLGLSVPQIPDYTTFRPQMTYGNRLLLQTEEHFQASPHNGQVAETGWSWGISTGDFDNDGDEDIYLVNGHISNASAQDYAKDFWLYDIYLGNSQPDPTLDAHFTQKQNATRAAGHSFGGHELNRFFLNRGDQGFLEVAYLLGLSLQEDCRNLVSGDLDGDGKLEWLTATFESWPNAKQALHLFPNFTEETGNWVGAHLHSSPSKPVTGAVALLTTTNGTQSRYLVTGDSYRAQHAQSVHFGIGKLTAVEELTIRWVDGSVTTMLSPPINQYHTVHADSGRLASN